MSDFHFIRPWWLLAFIVLFLLLNLLKKIRVSRSGWQQIIPPHLANRLITGEQKTQSFSLLLPLMIGSLTILALAGPTWQKLPQPVYNVERGSVIIMDMSMSMYATDLKPNRLTHARYKASDLLDNLDEGDIGLIAYAGASFVISPLTEDIDNIKLLLPSLSPDLMPEQGSDPYQALLMANDMFINAGHKQGDIYWFTDGVDNYDIENIRNFTKNHPHNINILGIGTPNGAPIKLSNGELLKDNSGAIVVPNLTIGALQGIAEQGRGEYQTINTSNQDINALLANYKNRHAAQERKNEQKESSLAGDQWQEAGPYLLLILLPLVLSYFRRGAIFVILPCLFLINPSTPVYAQEAQTASSENATTNTGTFWQNLWKTKDQQGQKSFDQEQYQQAAEQFDNKMWQGSAAYRAGNYEAALQAFKQGNDAQALYNQGNSLAKLQKIDEAIKAYEQALKKDPNFAAAANNKKLLEDLKKQQQEQQGSDQNNQQQENSDQQNSDQQNQQQSQSDNQEQNSQNDQQQDSQNSQQQDGDQNQQPDNQQSNSEQNQQEQQNAEENNQQNEQQSAQQQAQNDAEDDAQETAIEQQADAPLSKEEQEAAQKYQQLLKKVTDDPYLLLRNKMQLEYQKRRQQPSGVTKKW